MSDDTKIFIKKQFELPPYWKLATIRCGIYAIIVGWGSFEAGVEGYDALSLMSNLQLIKLAGGILVSMLGVWLAFLDNSMTQIKNNSNPPTPDAPAPTNTPKYP